MNAKNLLLILGCSAALMACGEKPADTAAAPAAPAPVAAAPAPAPEPAPAPVAENAVGKKVYGSVCSMCHAAEPAWEGVHWPPKDVVLETPAQIAHEARRIYMQSGLSHAMPPANLSYMEPAERAAIVDWFRSAGQGGVEG